MAGTLKRSGSRVLGTLGGAALMVAASSAVRGQPKAIGPEPLIGTWRGTSVCTDRVAAPACKDETVVYEFTAGAEPGTVHWVADKVVNGKREPMGELELAYDKGEACWKAEFGSPPRVVWCLVVDGTRLSGTGRLLPGKETVRKIDVRRVEPRPRKAG
jgi:hypothetical protein